MSGRRGACVILAALITLVAAWVPRAVGYGTGTVFANASGGASPGAWASVAAAADDADGGASAILTESEAGGLAASAYPANGAFAADASGWGVVDTDAALCDVDSAWTGADGSPAGAIRTQYSTLVNLLNTLATCSARWTSSSFTWTGGAPAAVSFSVDRRLELGSVTADWSVRLVDETAGTSAVLVSESRSTSAGWGTVTAPGLSSATVVSGHAYHLRIDVSFSSTLSLASSYAASFDDVALAVTPQNKRASGELRVDDVPIGTTHTLELRAHTSAEPFEVQLWDGSGWSTRATVSTTAPSFATATHGLTAGEWNGGAVRVRFRDTSTGVDATADVLSIDYLRVVSTGGITLSGPASVAFSGLTLDGLASATATATLGPIEVVDAGGLASGWSLTATASRWALVGDPTTLLPADALRATAATPTSPAGSDLAGVAAGSGGALGPSTAATLMEAAPGHGIGSYRTSPGLTLTVPVNAIRGTYRSTVTLSAS